MKKTNTKQANTAPHANNKQTVEGLFNKTWNVTFFLTPTEIDCSHFNYTSQLRVHVAAGIRSTAPVTVLPALS